MNKYKFIRFVSDETKIRVKECEFMVNAILRCIKDVLATGEDVYLNDFGKFVVERRAPRLCVMPDGTELTAPGKIIIKFRPSVSLKEEMVYVPHPDELKETAYYAKKMRNPKGKKFNIILEEEDENE